MKRKKQSVIRLAKFIAASGVASRRQAEKLILAGQVSVDGQIIDKVATNVSDDARVKVGTKLIKREHKVYYLLHKPVGYVTTKRDPHNHQTVMSLVPARPSVFPVGRLDKDSAGLLLMTNDGELTYELTHPKFAIKKIYRVRVNKAIDKKLIKDLKHGIRLREGLARADQARLIDKHTLEITLHQGWNRQIRRMLRQLGYQVIMLTRIQEGKLKLGDLASGQYRQLTKQEIKK